MSAQAANFIDNGISMGGGMGGAAVIRASRMGGLPNFRLPIFPSALMESSGWILPEGGGGAAINGRWYTEHALERMAPNTPQVMAQLEARALKRASAKGLQPGTREFGDWWLINGPDPRGIPPSVIEAEIINSGATHVRVMLNKQGNVITVIPGGK